MIHINLITHIYRPLTQVFNFISSPENDFQWQYGTLASTQISEGTPRIGTTFRTVGHFLGRRIESLNQVTEFEPNRKYGFKSISGSVDSQSLFIFEMSGGSTQITLALQVDQRDLFGPSDAAVEKQFKRQYKENLAMLKDLLEVRSAARAGA